LRWQFPSDEQADVSMTRQPSSPELRRIQGELNLSGLLLRQKMRQSGRAKGISKARLSKEIKSLFDLQNQLSFVGDCYSKGVFNKLDQE